HIHVPEGATPKDGPSAGITMATALVSALTGRAVRKDVGMTGEITLRGRVLPIGGLKGKALSAHRAGITTIIIPADKERDIDHITECVLKALPFMPVRHVDEGLKHVLVGVYDENNERRNCNLRCNSGTISNFPSSRYCINRQIECIKVF